MNLLIGAMLGAGLGAGVVVAAVGLTGRQLLVSGNQRRPGSRAGMTFGRQPLMAAGAGIVVLVATRWPAAGLMVAAAVWVMPKALGGRAARAAAIARTEAIAAWCEMVRDSIVAASGLEEAICATGRVAPEPIATEVEALVDRLRRQNQPLADALARFGTEVDHPSSDLVVAALATAARMEVSDLSSLLSRLAEAIRDDARMRVRVEVGRTRVRTAAKVIVVVVLATALVLTVASRDYLDAYDGATGQAMLLMVGAVFALGAWLLERMATVRLPERFRTAAGRSADAEAGVTW